MFTWFDPLYFVFLAPALLLSAWASWKVHHAYAVAREIPPPPALRAPRPRKRSSPDTE